MLQEYVSCPSCGRTLFDLQEVSAQIREKTSHLPGVSVNSLTDLLPPLFSIAY
jgi:(E)-4-hydroxy-3-methylbut-2-enyl-diphosphate synthase